jgi:predicted amidohydrolase
MQDLKITLIQSNLVWENTDINLQGFDDKLDSLKLKTDLIVLPEMFNTGFTMNVDKCAETMDGKAMQWLKQKAQALQSVIAGSLLIKEKNMYFNRLIWMKPDGSYEYYNKRHLFRMVNEHHTISQGKERKIVTLKNWKINLQVCYDLRFPVWSKNNYADEKHEYDVLLYVANWPEIRNHAYKILIPARAIENQAYVVWVNRVGEDGNKIMHAGESMVVNPKGIKVINANAHHEEILHTTLSAKELIYFRQKFQIGLDWDQFSINN